MQKYTIILSALILALFCQPVLAEDASKKTREGLFEKLDMNHDGKVSREENEKSSLAYFEKMDGSGDGNVTQEEFMSAIKLPEGAKLDTAQQERLKAVKMKAFERQDTDKNGIISREEYKKHATERFVRMDFDKDGKLVKGDIEKTRAAMRAEYEKMRAAKDAGGKKEKP